MEYLPGVCAGVSQTLVGHPFDTLKTLIQNRQSWRDLGIRGYYRGVIPPLIGSTLFTGILFPTYHVLDDILYQQHWLSGAITGFILTPTIFTLESLKILRQINEPLAKETFFRTHGLKTTFIKESFATSIYFSTYEICRDLGWSPLLAGSMSGFANCTAIYPLDVIRTRQVAQQIPFDTASQQGHLYRGIGITATRAMIVNGILFSTYEAVKDFVKQDRLKH